MKPPSSSTQTGVKKCRDAYNGFIENKHLPESRPRHEDALFYDYDSDKTDSDPSLSDEEGLLTMKDLQTGGLGDHWKSGYDSSSSDDYKEESISFVS
jgi:hypothetical protein